MYYNTNNTIIQLAKEERDLGAGWWRRLCQCLFCCSRASPRGAARAPSPPSEVEQTLRQTQIILFNRSSPSITKLPNSFSSRCESQVQQRVFSPDTLFQTRNRWILEYIYISCVFEGLYYLIFSSVRTDICEFKGIPSTPNRNISDTQPHKEDEWQGQTPKQPFTISAISGHQWSKLLSDWFLPIEYFDLLLPAQHQKLLSLCPALCFWQGHLRAKSGSKGFVWKAGHGLSASWVLYSSCWCQWP